MKIDNWRAVVLVVFFALVMFPGILLAAEPLPDTGQTKFYNNSSEISQPAPGANFHGQDAQYNASERQHSYTKLNANGSTWHSGDPQWVMVKDNVTGLIWEVKTDDGSIHDRDNKYNWSSAQTVFIADLNSGSGFCSHTDWRLPTIKELSWIVDSGRSGSPHINTGYFPQTVSSYYWSSTTCAHYTSYAWRVHFYDGLVYGYYKSSNDYVRAVRSGQ